MKLRCKFGFHPWTDLTTSERLCPECGRCETWTIEGWLDVTFEGLMKAVEIKRDNERMFDWKNSGAKAIEYAEKLNDDVAKLG